MPVKRLNIELPVEQYEFLRQEAEARKTTISQLLRDLIDHRKKSSTKAAKRNYAKDPFFQRKGSFDGPADLAARHDSYLYGRK
ncbi:MAG: ribbon-helix-helix protein, CopG family [Candidatus Aminicenantes bacterium]|nr:ribbon-helix-helix protein, CopG family [Candidatus Aminicenantes bacterium]